MSVTIRLPWPPSTNSYWETKLRYPARKHRRPGKEPRKIPVTVLSEAAEDYRRMVKVAVFDQFGPIAPLDCRLAVSIRAIVPDRRDRDLDNILKSLLDSLTHAGVWIDDSQIDRLAVERGRVESPGCVHVTIEQIPDPQGVLM